MTEFATLAGVAAATAVGYSIFKDARESQFELEKKYGGDGANSWPERWPEEWIEKHSEGFVDGAWYTHPPEYRVRARLKRHGRNLDEDDHFASEKDTFQTYYPFRVQWDLMRFDLEAAEERLATLRADMEGELAEVKRKKAKAYKEYVESAAHATNAGEPLTVIRRERHVAEGTKDSDSDSDPVRAADQLWASTKAALKKEGAAIERKYQARAGNFNLRADKIVDHYSRLYWMRNVRVIPLNTYNGIKAQTRQKVKIAAALKVTGAKTGDRESGHVDVELEWTETHKVLGTYTWKEEMRITADGRVHGQGKLSQRFSSPPGVGPSKLRIRPVSGGEVRNARHRVSADAARRRHEAEQGRTERGAFERIPDKGIAGPSTHRAGAAHEHSHRKPAAQTLSFVEQAVRLKVGDAPVALRIVDGERVAFCGADSAHGLTPVRIKRRATNAFRITNARKLSERHKEVLSKAFQSHHHLVTFED